MADERLFRDRLLVRTLEIRPLRVGALRLSDLNVARSTLDAALLRRSELALERRLLAEERSRSEWYRRNGRNEGNGLKWGPSVADVSWVQETQIETSAARLVIVLAAVVVLAWLGSLAWVIAWLT